jgi:hypothetical protein
LKSVTIKFSDKEWALIEPHIPEIYVPTGLERWRKFPASYLREVILQGLKYLIIPEFKRRKYKRRKKYAKIQ